MLYQPPQHIDQYRLTQNGTPFGPTANSILYGPLQNSAPLISGLPQNSMPYGPPQNATQYGYRTPNSTPYGPPQSSRLSQADISLVDTVRNTVLRDTRCTCNVKFYSCIGTDMISILILHT